MDPWILLAVTLASVYTLGVTVFLALQNRSPQSTFAWVLLFVLFPPGAWLTYIMFGRGRHVFSRELTMAKLLERSTLAERAVRVVAAQPDTIARLAGTQGEFARMAAMLWASGRSPLTMGNRLEILQNASEKYPRLLNDIRAASQSVHLLYYEWASDAFTEKVAELLREKIRCGVEVRILYDPIGSYFMLRRDYVNRLLRDGVHMQPFSSVYELHTLSYRSHRKLAILDGRVGYSGGLNMTEKHLTGPKGFTGWRDTHARISGEAVTDLQSVFATMWTNATGEDLFDERYFPAVETADDGIPIQVVSAGPDSRWETIRQAYSRLPDPIREFGCRNGLTETIATPLLLGSRTLGWMTVCSVQASEPESRWWRVVLIEAIAHQAALALHHSRLIDLHRAEERRKGILEERNRLARDIHDNLAQGFAAILMQLQAAQREGPGILPTIASKIETAVDLARTHLTEARRSVGALRPNVGNGENVATALKRLADLSQRTSNVPIDLVVEELPRLGDGIEREIVAIAQEALTNAVRHSQARRIVIRASSSQAVGVRLSVVDDGRGIAREPSSDGFGMTSMQERAERIGASLTIVTAPRNGTEVVLAWQPSSLPTQVHVAN